MLIPAIVVSLMVTASWAQSLTWLGTLGGDESRAYGVSADGSVVVGISWDAAGIYRAFRWTAGGGMANLGTLGGDWSWGGARGVSADGSVVVGSADNAAGDDRAFRWTPGGGMQDLGTLGGDHSRAYAVSPDGSVVVGRASRADWLTHAFRWTAAGGTEDLGTLPGSVWSEAFAVSADGLVVAGQDRNAAGQYRAFRWTAAGGMENLGYLSWYCSDAYAVSADGSIVVGVSDGSAFRWTAAGGMEDLNITYADLLSGSSWLTEASAISPDGRYIVGFGWNDLTDRNEAFLLDTVPEPASLALLGLGTLLLRRR